MKKLNALALSALMAPAYALGIGNAMAAEQDGTATTQQEASDSVAEERRFGKDDTSSSASAEGGHGSGAASEAPNDQTRDSRAADTTPQKASESMAGDDNPGVDETSSGDTAGAQDGSGTADAPTRQTREAGNANTTEPKASESVAGDGNSGGGDTSSATTVETGDEGGTANVQTDRTREPGRGDTPDRAADTEPAFHAGDLIGKEIKSRNDDATFGTISDLVFGENGQLLSVIVEVGGFLGIGEEQVTISWSELERQLDADGKSYVIYRQP